jgi:hypothetical protein
MANDPLTEWPDGYTGSFAGVPDDFERPPQEPPETAPSSEDLLERLK